MGRSVAPTAVLESLERLAEAAGPARASDARLVRRAIREALPAEAATMSYSAPEAADRLNVTLPTVHVWLRAGVLQAATDSRPKRLRLERDGVDVVARKVRELRRHAPRTRKLRDVVEWLEYQKYADRLGGPRRLSDRRDVPVSERLAKIWGRRRERAASKRR
ncbi:MAG: hypothetical protein HYX53_11595 [Chloroflexi bacterium]|nr:hypothetical protein [Chloroflexota bacterium]